MNFVNGITHGLLIVLIIAMGLIWKDVRGVHTGEVETACAMTPVQVPAIENNGVAVIHFKCQVRR